MQQSEQSSNRFTAPLMMLCAFIIYFSMYAFRKPFAAGEYHGLAPFGSSLTWKVLFINSQLCGYVLSKLIGARICSEVQPRYRFLLLMGLIVVAQTALLGFAWLPQSWKFAAMFFNGLPLGMIWGLVILSLEGRRNSELLMAGLSVSYILAGGVVKDIGLWVMSASGGTIDEYWMPAAVGAIFLPIICLFAWLLNCFPAPDFSDKLARTERKPMDRAQRNLFFQQHLLPLWPLFLFFMVLTAVRDYRHNFAREIIKELGYAQYSAVFTKSDSFAALAVIVTLGLMYRITNHRRALNVAYCIMLTGMIVVGISTWAFAHRWIGGFAWLVTVGASVYCAYVPFGALLFERIVAILRFPGTAVYAINIADFIGYGGTFVNLLWLDHQFPTAAKSDVFTGMCYLLTACSIPFLLLVIWRLNRPSNIHDT